MAEMELASSIRDARGIALERLVARLGLIPTDSAYVRNLDTVPAAALPAIAWGWGLLGPIWDQLPNAATRRAFLKEGYNLKALKGTPWAVIRAAYYLGWPGARVIENQEALIYDGTADYTGAWYYGTGFFNWWEWALEVPVAGRGYAITEHNQLVDIVPTFARKSSRMMRVDLAVEDLVTHGLTPAFTGTTAIVDIGVSEDGTTWHRRPLMNSVAGPGNTAKLSWRLFETVDGPYTVNHFALFQADNAIFTQQLRTPGLYKALDSEMSGSWTLNW